MSVERARELRKRMTPQEVRLWARLRELRALGLHPRRQAPIGGFVADFAFLRQKLLIEVDGGQHGVEPQRDLARDARLAAEGFRTLRFWNVDVDRNIQGVLETILAALEERRRG